MILIKVMLIVVMALSMMMVMMVMMIRMTMMYPQVSPKMHCWTTWAQTFGAKTRS